MRITGDVFNMPEKQHYTVIKSAGSEPRLDANPGSLIGWLRDPD